MESVDLPIKNDSGYFEIRLESIGGLGANLCGKMLGELGLNYLGLNSTSFSSYGSEKTGTPVKAYIRYCQGNKDIRVHSPVVKPHILCIFHEALISEPAIFDGCTSETIILINTDNEEKINECICQGDISCRMVYCVPTQKIAMETHSRINVVMLGAMAKIMGFMPLECVNEICKDTLGKKYPNALSGNLEGIRRGFDEVSESTISCRNNENAKKQLFNGENEITKKNILNRENETEDKNENPKTMKASKNSLGYMNATLGGINTDFGNTVTNDLSPSRQGYIPIFIKERCINCGLCDSTCPDMVFQFEKGVYNGREMMVNGGLDYYHCKGCLRCVEICPVQALVKGLESEHKEKKWFMPNKELTKLPQYYDKSGADGYITSESYLTEKRMDGGEV